MRRLANYRQARPCLQLGTDRWVADLLRGRHAQEVENLKNRLSFCEITQDGDDEGCFRVTELPTAKQATLIRRALGLHKRQDQRGRPEFLKKRSVELARPASPAREEAEAGTRVEARSSFSGGIDGRPSGAYSAAKSPLSSDSAPLAISRITRSGWSFGTRVSKST